MQKNISKLTVFFDDPFWVGICERFANGKVEVCKITFGTEPKDYEVWQFILQNWSRLRFSSPLEAQMRRAEHANPKRMQRVIKKQLKTEGVGTKSQQALKIQHEENKLIRKSTRHKQKEDKRQQQYEQRQKKRKEKHKGR